LKIVKIEFLIKSGPFHKSPEFEAALNEIKNAIYSVTYPEGSTDIIAPKVFFLGFKAIALRCLRAAGKSLFPSRN
jgi:hypothetical protein